MISKSKPTVEELNRLMAIPKVLRTDDGRKLLIKAWSPSAVVGELTTVTVEAWILEEPKACDPS